MLVALYADDDETIVAYALGTVEEISIRAEGCSYKIKLDRNSEVQENVQEESLFKSIEV